MMLTDRSLLI